MTPRAANLEKMPCHVDFWHIFLIALFNVFSLGKTLSKASEMVEGDYISYKKEVTKFS